MTRARDLASGSGIEAGEVVPHIIPGVLYPAVAGKLLDGSTSHGSTYGVAQADGFSYYYTDIKGSKPIKDPRIGAHFGSQRHKFKSLQLLEQESATHGAEVFSIDGREWMRSVTGRMDNGAHGLGLYWQDGTIAGIIEIVGYFSDANILGQTRSGTGRGFTWAVDGGSATQNDGFEAGVNSPLRSRHVDADSVLNLGLGATLGLHTLKLSTPAVSGDTPDLNGIELITQDTTSTTTKSQIQIPSQNVVSYGKKFSLSASAPHFNPFAFKTDGSTAWASGAHNGTSWPVGTGSSANIDTATSLGLANWLHSSNYYKPYNGGRVVVWVASDGTIKTSVNVMPPNARSIGNSASLTNATAKANASIANNTFYPTMEAGSIDHSLSEVAKTFHGREFGNGSANGGTGATYADASMVSTTNDDIAYVMDDGLTSLSGHAVHFNAATPNSVRPQNAASGDGYNLTFIGTGFSYNGNADMATSARHDTNLVQNLPYGTHIVQILRTGSSNVYTIKVDGVLVLTTVSGNNDNLAGLHECTFHQPKKPPIPEDAVVLADYMLMADFVPVAASGTTNISKGVRLCSCSRDMFCDETDDDAFSLVVASSDEYLTGFKNYLTSSADSDTSAKIRLPAFATNYVVRGYKMDHRGKLFIDDTDKDSASTRNNDDVVNSFSYLTNNEPLGIQNWGVNCVSGEAFYISAFEIASPIHTSSHYQSFGTPFLHELTGGDRNMEQNNLVVTPDGKTWDEVTRDTSYLGSVTLRTNTDMHSTSDTTTLIFDEWRGQAYGAALKDGYMNKDFAIAYDRVICLKTGHYRVYAQTKAQGNNNGLYCAWFLNGTESARTVVHNNSSDASVENNATTEKQFYLIRGDYLQLKGRWYNGMSAGTVLIERA